MACFMGFQGLLGPLMYLRVFGTNDAAHVQVLVLVAVVGTRDYLFFGVLLL